MTCPQSYFDGRCLHPTRRTSSLCTCIKAPKSKARYFDKITCWSMKPYSWNYQTEKIFFEISITFDWKNMAEIFTHDPLQSQTSGKVEAPLKIPLKLIPVDPRAENWELLYPSIWLTAVTFKGRHHAGQITENRRKIRQKKDFFYSCSF